MTKQLRLPIAKSLRPPKPTIRDETVARAIAERLVKEINLDDFYWEQSEIEDRVWDVQHEIMRAGHTKTVMGTLYLRQQPVSDTGERGGHPYGWEGIEERALWPELESELESDRG